MNPPTISDLEATVWLEQWLQRYPGTLLIISHDRSFLDTVIEQVVSFEGNRLVAYTGNYSAFEKLKAERLPCSKPCMRNSSAEQRIENFVRRFRLKPVRQLKLRVG